MNENMYEAMYNIEKTHWWFRAKRDIVLDIIGAFALPTDSKMIDFGCGTGIMLESLMKYGKPTGVDFSPIALQFCRKRFPGPLFQLNLLEKLPLEDVFDVGVALDVLEHLDDDLGALRNMKDVLKEGGRLVITVPAHMSLWSAHDENLAHKRRYNAKGLLNVFHAVGMEVEYLSYYNFWLFPITAFLRGVFKLFGIDKDSEAENRQSGKLVNAILYYIFKSEGFFIRRKMKLPFGVSIIAVVRRNDDDKAAHTRHHRVLPY